MQKFSPSEKIYVARSKIKNAGRGVFAKENIKKGEIVESCPVLAIPQNDTVLLLDSILVGYFYFLGKKKEKAILVLGYGSIYNHSHKANALYKDRTKNGFVDFVAKRDIVKNEEILVNYNPEGDSKDRLWFERNHKT